MVEASSLASCACSAPSSFFFLLKQKFTLFFDNKLAPKEIFLLTRMRNSDKILTIYIFGSTKRKANKMLETFMQTLAQMLQLFLFIAAGYVLSKLKAIPDNAATVLSKLENNIFIPASVLFTFMTQFNISSIGNAWQFFVGGIILVLVGIPIAMLGARICSKDPYIRKIYTYGLAFPNFGFMGYAVVLSLFPAVYSNYLIFTIPFWSLIYLWGVPALLIPKSGEKTSFLGRFKAFLNPMFVAIILGMILGLISPLFSNVEFLTSGYGKLFVDKIGNTIDTLGKCMSPVAMLLTGITIAKIDLKATFAKASLYAISLIRLIVIPLIFVVILIFLPIPFDIKVCAACLLAMPLGLNTIVVPSAYGLDTSYAAGMALISHLLSCVSIPFIFMIFEAFVK